MLKQLSYLTAGCLLLLLALLSSCGVFEEEEFDILPVVDCPRLALNFQDSCAVAGGGAGIVNEDCECFSGALAFCPDINASIGDSCITAAGNEGFVNSNCNCSDVELDDCALSPAEVDSCRLAGGTIVSAENSPDSCRCIINTDIFECPDLQQNIGDTCVNSDGLFGFVTPNCACTPILTDSCSRAFIDSCLVSGGTIVQDSTANACDCQPENFDCPDLSLNFEDRCINANGEVGTVDINCNCRIGNLQFDCPNFQLDVGDSCLVNNRLGIINNDCECDPDEEFDCPELQSDLGQPCRNADGLLGITNADCECAPFDCQDIPGNIGQRCFNVQENKFGEIQPDCSCFVPASSFDCPNLQQDFGSPCSDNTGSQGLLDINCECDLFACQEFSANAGDSCFHQPSQTWGRLQDDCTCEVDGDAFDCPELFRNIGDACTTSDSLSGSLNEDCACAIYDCQEFGGNVGDRCFNTQAGRFGTLDEDCNCFVEPIVFDCPDIELNIGDSCLIAPRDWGEVNESCQCVEI